MQHDSAVVLFSGGQDSTTCLGWSLQRFERVEALAFNYGQRHLVELACADRIASKLGVPLRVLDFGFLSSLGKNALVDHEVTIEVGGEELPTSFVPGRNLLFLTAAAAYAKNHEISNLVAGVCQTDYSGYPDCRRHTMCALETTFALGMESDIRIWTPLMDATKAQTWEMAARLEMVDFVIEESHTCYEGDREHRHSWGYGCGVCPACELRRRGFEEWGGC